MKLLYVTTISNTINAFLIPHIKLLIEKGHEVNIACNIVQEISTDLVEIGCKVYNVEFNRSPIKKENVKAYKELKSLIINEEYDVVHTHTPIASALVRLACRNLKQTKVVYTAHGFHFYEGSSFKNWLIYYPIEKILSKKTEVLITINKEDFKRAKNSFKSKKIEYIPGIGLNTLNFGKSKVTRNEKLESIGIPDDAFVILSVGELNQNKNHETIIKAISNTFDSNTYYLICGEGPLEKKLKKLSKKLKIENNVKFLGHRKDLSEIYSAADIFVFPSKREGLGMAALEAMCSGLPIITSNVHGIVDYSMHGKTGFLCNSSDVNEFAKYIAILRDNNELRIEMGQSNKTRVDYYNIENIKLKMLKIYNEIM
ncbi:glycosyltransferase family 4 protein [Planococcus kocurii]|uniref:glycosyltransferase family 4 protein n=1 Tax=Planococcus kocurii TaxID=1374 RepID=UPI003CFF0CD1